MAFSAIRQDIIDALASAMAEATGWNAVVKTAIPVANVVRTSATVVTITLPAVASYNITTTEVIHITIPASALTLAAPIVTTPVFTVSNTGAATFSSLRQAVIDGLTSAQSEANGWNARVRAVMATSAVVRTSPSVVTITVPATALYNITAPETITATIPESVLIGPNPVIASPTIAIATDAATFNGLRQSIIDGFVSAQAEGTGWNARRSTIPVSALVRTSPTTATLTIPADSGYNITANETITITVPAAAVASGSPVVISNAFGISFINATVALTGVVGTAMITTPIVSRIQALTGIQRFGLAGTVMPVHVRSLFGNSAFGLTGVLGTVSANLQAPTTSFKVGLLNGLHVFGATEIRGATTADSFKAALYFATASRGPDDTIYSSAGEATGAGYSAGGIAVTNAVAPTSSGTTAYWTPSASFVYSSITITTAFDAILLYNNSFSTKRAVAVFTFPSQTITSGTFTMAMPANTASTALIRLT